MRRGRRFGTTRIAQSAETSTLRPWCTRCMRSTCVAGLRLFSRESLLLLRFDDIVLRPVDVLQRVAKFLALPPFPSNFKVEYGRENYTTIARLLKSGAVTPQNLKALEDFFRPHDATLREMFGGEAFW